VLWFLVRSVIVLYRMVFYESCLYCWMFCWWLTKYPTNQPTAHLARLTRAHQTKKLLLALHAVGEEERATLGCANVGWLDEQISFSIRWGKALESR
jgi:hypothetical protein